MSLQTVSLCYRYDHWTFDPDQRRLHWHDGLVCELSIYENRLLAKLCHHAGEVIGFASLHQALFYSAQEQAHPLTPSLEQTLTSLKKKLAQHQKHPFILDEIRPFGLRAPIPKTTSPTEIPTPWQDHAASKKTSYKSDDDVLRKIIALSAAFLSVVIALTHLT